MILSTICEALIPSRILCHSSIFFQVGSWSSSWAMVLVGGSRYRLADYEHTNLLAPSSVLVLYYTRKHTKDNTLHPELNHAHARFVLSEIKDTVDHPQLEEVP